MKEQHKRGYIKKLPGAVAAVYDRKTGIVYTATSGKSSKPLHPILRRRQPSESQITIGHQKGRSPEVCAEVNAVNNALLKGAKVENLEVYTVKTSTGDAFPRCAVGLLYPMK